MIVAHRAMIVLGMLLIGVVFIKGNEMLGYEFHEINVVMLFVVMLVMLNEGWDNSEQMRHFRWNGNNRNEKKQHYLFEYSHGVNIGINHKRDKRTQERGLMGCVCYFQPFAKSRETKRKEQYRITSRV